MSVVNAEQSAFVHSAYLSGFSSSVRCAERCT
jgi:hypothetical protein